MNEIHILSVGRADCAVLLLEEHGQQRCVLLDAGWYPPGAQATLQQFLKSRQISQIDLVIITHLHMDHIAALPGLKDLYPILRIIAPTKEPLAVTESLCQTQPGNKYLLSLKAYSQFIHFCQRNGTILEDVMDYAQGGRLHFGPSSLRCLYPLAETELLSSRYALEMCRPGLDTASQIACENLSRKHANGDSSVWLLEHAGRQIALFMGDAPLETLLTVSQRYELHPELVKLPHHGLPDGYFSAQALKPLQPRQLVVSTDESRCEQVRQLCLPIAKACGAPIHFTFEGNFQYTF